jgi:DNA replication protein DnaC
MQNPERHGTAWSAEEEKKLYDAFVSGMAIADIAAAHERKPGGIRAYLQKLGLLDAEGNVVSPRPDFAPSAVALKREARKTAKEEKRKKLSAHIPPQKDIVLTPELNERFRHALSLMEDTNQNLFITGKAGTGKSTLLSYFCRTTKKEPVVLAPTGVAALNVKGQTIHRFFNFYVDVTPEKIQTKQSKPRNTKLYKKLKTIIIDEVSMVRADLLDCIDVFLRMYGPDPSRIFGGVQMIFVGDLYQLPPVVTSQEKEIFASHYATPYFFSAHALADNPPQIVELDKVYRQKDLSFVNLLNKIRNNSVDADDIEHLNSRLRQSHTAQGDNFHITLTTTNAIADGINDAHLQALKGKLHTSVARVAGDFGREYFPTLTELPFKIGAQIMLLNNDTERRWVNGSIGVIQKVETDDAGDEFLVVKLQDNNNTVAVYPFTWEVYKFGVENNAIVSEPVGTFTQYPFRLAWAITIHKSQGKTFERVVIDIGRGTFMAGQMYVALSRCTSFEGVSLKTPVRAQDIRTDHRIFSFFTAPRYLEAERAMPVEEKISFIKKAIADEVLLDIVYLKADDTQTERTVIPLHVGTARYQGKEYEGMKATCTLRQDERMFRVDRILKIGRAE